VQESRDRDLLLVAAGELSERAFACTVSIHPCAARRRSASASQPKRAYGSRRVIVKLSSIDAESASPSPLRSSLTKPSPCAMLARGVRAGGEIGREVNSATRTAPDRIASSPKTQRRSSLRPAPTSPASPKISPRLSSRLTPRGERTPDKP